MSGAGKSTIAEKVEEVLLERGMKVEVLDGELTFETALRQAKEILLDEPRNVSRIIRALMLACAAVVLADLFYDKEHTEYAFQGWIGFDAVYGFVCCVFLVLAAKQLRRLLMRDEDYYDD